MERGHPEANRTNQLGAGLLQMRVWSSIVSLFQAPSRIDLEVKEESRLPGNGPSGANCLSRLLWWWVNPLVSHASSKPITSKMLWPLEDSHLAGNLINRFDVEWDSMKKQGDPSLQAVLWRMFKWSLIVTGLGWLLSMLLMLSFPFLIREILTWYENDDSPIWRGYMLVVILFVVHFLQTAIVLSHVIMKLYVLGMDLRTLCNALVYRKSLRLSTSARQELGVGKIMTLMSADAENFPRTMLFMHALWVNPLFIIIIIYFLINLIGLSSLVGIGIIVLSIPLQAKMGFKQMMLQKKLLSSTDRRVHLVTETLDSIKILKFYAWEASFEERIKKLRSSEIVNILDFAYVNAANIGLAAAIPVLMILLTLITYYEIGGDLKPDIIFTAISLLFLIRFPLVSIPIALGSVLRGKASLRRLDQFLSKSEISWRGIKWESRSGSKSETGGDIVITNATFQWPLAQGEMETKSNAEAKENDGKSTAKLLMHSPDAKQASGDAESTAELKEAGSNVELKAGSNVELKAGSTVELNIVDENPNNKFKLSNINMGTECGRLVGVIGNVGSGKSSLLQAILGDMPMIERTAAMAFTELDQDVKAEILLQMRAGSAPGSTLTLGEEKSTGGDSLGSLPLLLKQNSDYDSGLGQVKIEGSIAYCAQSAWIINATVRDNILFRKPMKPHFYQRVIQACALEQDIKQLPAGEFTEIGEKGINLSGGQKQRIALARAVYANADNYLLDDILSAVDAHVASHIFKNVIIGLLKGKKVIMATNSLQFVSQLDTLVVLKDGKISEKGTYQQLMKNQAGFFTLMKSYGGEKNNEVDKDANKDENSDEKKPEAQESDLSGDTKEESTKQYESKPGALNPQTKNEETKKAHDGKLTSQEHIETGALSYSTIKYMFVTAMGSWWVPLLLIFISVIAQGSLNLFEWWLAVWSEAYLEGGGESEDYFLYVYCVLGVVAIVMAFARAGAFAKALAISSEEMHNSLVCCVMRAPMSFFDTTPTGRIINRFSKDMDQIDTSLQRSVPLFVQLLLQVIGVAITVILLVPIFLLAVLPLMFLYHWIQKYFRPVARGLQRLENVSRSPIFSGFSEALTGVTTVRAFSMAETMNNELVDMINASNKPFYLMHNCNRWLQLRLEALGAIVILIIGVIIIAGRESSFIAMNAGIAGLLLTYAQQITQTINMALRTGVETEARMTSVERIREYSILPSEAPRLNNNLPKPKGWPQQGELVIENLSMRYRPALPLVLKGVSLKISPGLKVGICGRTGSGKSSLMTALFRLVEPQKGSKIQLDGIDCLQIGLSDLRSSMAIIPQDPYLFQGSVRYNLDPFDDYTDKEIWEALRCAELNPLISNLDGQLSYKVEEGGKNFSLGQRQVTATPNEPESLASHRS